MSGRGLGADDHRGCDRALLQLLDGCVAIESERLDRDVEGAEQDRRGHRRAAAGRPDIDLLAGEIGEALDVRPRQHMHFLRAKPRHHLKPLGEVVAGALRLGACEHVGRNKTRIDVRVMQEP